MGVRAAARARSSSSSCIVARTSGRRASTTIQSTLYGGCTAATDAGAWICGSPQAASAGTAVAVAALAAVVRKTRSMGRSATLERSTAASRQSCCSAGARVSVKRTRSLAPPS